MFYTDILHSGIPDADSAHRPLWTTRYESDHLSGSCGTRHKADVLDYVYFTKCDVLYIKTVLHVITCAASYTDVLCEELIQ